MVGRSIEAKEVKWTITSVIVPIPTQKGSPTYTGAPQTPEWDNFDQVNSKVQVTATDQCRHPLCHIYSSEWHVVGRFYDQ